MGLGLVKAGSVGAAEGPDLTTSASAETKETSLQLRFFDMLGCFLGHLFVFLIWVY